MARGMVQVTIFMSMGEKNPELQARELWDYGGCRGFAIDREDIKRITGATPPPASDPNPIVDPDRCACDASARRYGKPGMGSCGVQRVSVACLLEVSRKPIRLENPG
jgi:hypothetical protein